jgi:hypothetical protein
MGVFLRWACQAFCLFACAKDAAAKFTANLQPISNCVSSWTNYKCKMIRLNDWIGSEFGITFRKKNISEGRPGQKTVPARKILEVALWILNTGRNAHDAAVYPNYKTVHRRFQSWCQSEILRRVLTDAANELRARGVLDEKRALIHATFAMAKGGGDDNGATKRRKV